MATLVWWPASDHSSSDGAGTQQSSRVTTASRTTESGANASQPSVGSQATKPTLPAVASSATTTGPPAYPAANVRPPPAPAPAPAPAHGLSADHAKVLVPDSPEIRPPSLAELHAQFSAEAKDPNWASEMEQYIHQLIDKNNSTAEFEVLAVECRTTLCEVRAFGNLPNSAQSWNRIGDEIGKQPWWSGFQGNFTSSFNQNGRITIVTILQRARR